MRGRVVLGGCVALAVLLGACGGSNFDAAVHPTTTTASTTTTTESPEARAWVAAAEHGLLSDPDRPPGVTNADASCMSHALVDTVTVERLKAAGTTLADLSDPNRDLPPRLASIVPVAVKAALGRRLQDCGFGRLMGPVVTRDVADGIGNGYATSAGEQQCVERWLAAPAQRVIVADTVLATDPTPSEAHDLARLVVDCLDMSRAFAPFIGVTLSAPESACINATVRADSAFLDAVAKEISGSTAGSNEAYALVGARILKCLTPEHILQVGRAHSRTGA